jgi:tyrosine-protein kinase Etk/Wzc
MISANRIAMADVDRRIAEVEKEVLRLPLNERKLLGIERRFNLNDKLYTYLMEKRAEAAISRAANISDNRIIDYARPDQARLVTPKRSRNYMLSLVLGFHFP